ncbi:hypothetical protein [Actinomadura sp. HBU206391]|uniref:hypothetical protein n=1 Tax=Actinomadura sp. HBU206391 TaxID=2731692 RepID=UPI001C9D0203|nr:hypothetical protein [Actinomadura sp. HBU206391]
MTFLLTTATYVVVTGFLYGCTRADEKLADNLDRLEILDSRPNGAIRADGHYSGCDDDDRFAYAGQEYRWTGARDDVVAFYRQAVEQDGWRLEQVDPPVLSQRGSEGPPPLTQGEHAHRQPPPPVGPVAARSPLCVTKSIADTTGYLSLSFLGDLAKGEGNHYSIEITASHDGEGGC